MILNATIFVQAFHFFIAYLLINTLILKPAVRIINAEQQEQFSHIQAIENLKKALAEQQQKMAERLQQLKNLFVTHTPRLPDVQAKLLDTQMPTPPAISPKLHKDLVKQLAETIVSKVHDVH